MKNDNGENGITQLPLSMNSFYTLGKLICCVFVVHPSIIFIYQIINFWFTIGLDFFCKLCDDVCNFKR
jgi:hypothetical protein